MPLRQRITRRVLTSSPVKTIISGSKRVPIPFGEFTLYEISLPFFEQLKRANLTERASAISFNIFMAFPPVLIFVFTLIPYLPISEQFIQEMFTLIKDVIPGEENNSVIISFLNDFLKRPRNELLSFGLVLAIFFSSNAMMGILRSFDEEYYGFIKRKGLQTRLTALRLTLIVFALAGLTILLLIAQGAVLEWLGVENYWIRFTIHNLRWVIIVLLIFYSTAFIYRQGPALAKKWPYLTPGSLLATTLTIIATLASSIWVENFNNYNKLYGSISAIFILMTLIYVNALVLLLGFELNVTLFHLRQKKTLEEFAAK
jgi:membrane protein